MTIKRTDFIWFNGEIILWNAAKVHVMSHALHYGTSVFEGIRCYDSYQGPVIFCHREHMQRLLNSAKIYRMSVIWSIDQLMDACRSILKKNKLVNNNNIYIRPLIFNGDVGIDIDPTFHNHYHTDVVIAVFYWPVYLGNKSFEEGIDVMVSSWRRVPADTIPTMSKAGGNYLSSLLISNEARRHGYQEGIGLDIHGYVSECSGENIFIVKDEIVFTPPLSSSILPGITRAAIIKLLEDSGLVVKEEVFSRESLYLADEIFISGTASEIIPVRSVDGIFIGTGKRGSVTKKLQELFLGLFTGITRDKWHWLDRVNI
ncbi:branched-chain amino acid transaminase [Blochmannia endosymbiont of Polyrhachis (Hedomyrma) turneri]|uniref:branched-chain amino acid transaminase n=1 Tax=Blochmannia endosymbiont of Polyrhachis (Hedomyrma) turneri TaxID=1505596 RepID=UPI00061A687B|nr:branched-chain amino acid transaminase [Blochmannia endosymbiont of Polyrhachis (Hedomyrma) turneri]AKC60145.1 branched-chain amino acid aminotransferase [Blochmannia endosymbiont of Polyrhachis (Hedomyrma) turneri]